MDMDRIIITVLYFGIIFIILIIFALIVLVIDKWKEVMKLRKESQKSI